MIHTVDWRRLTLAVVMLMAAVLMRTTPQLQAGQAVVNNESTREIIIGVTPAFAERVQRTAVGARSSGVTSINQLAAQYQVVAIEHLYDNARFAQDSRALTNGLVGTLVVTLPSGIDVNRFMADAKNLPEVDYAEVNYRVRLLAQPTKAKPTRKNGVTVASGDATWQAVIRVKGTRKTVCSATIIDKKWVLTAAQCIQGRRITSLEVTAGSRNALTFRGAQVRQLSRAVVHPRFDRVIKVNDVALIELRVPFTLNKNVQVVPIALSRADVDTNRATMIGWGMSRPGVRPAVPALRKSDAVIKSELVCQRSIGTAFFDGMLCATPAVANKTRTQLCNSDIGAALTAQGRDGSYVIGVASSSLVCTDRNPGVYTDITSVTSWINEYVPIITPTVDEGVPDPMFGDQWGLANADDTDIDVTEAWAVSRGAASTMIAVIDTGVALAHPDLAGARLRTDIDYDFINSDNNADDDNGHGTHVAGIVAASTDNGIGVAGICADCEILPVKVLDAEGSGAVSTIAQGLRYAADQGADIANMSLGMDPNCGCSETLANAINYAYERGMFMIAAAGNDGIDKIGYPASSSRVLAVGATDISGERAYFSNYGTQLDIVAPGHDIWSTYTTPEYDELSGTSMASPMVAGVAGLALSARGMSQPQLWWLLKNATDATVPGAFDNELGYGRINAFSAVTMPVTGSEPIVADTCDESQNPNCNECSMDLMLGQSASGQSKMQMLYSFRDNVLQSHATGMRLQSLFYRHTIELLGIMARNESIRAEGEQLYTLFEPAIRGMVNQQTAGLTFTPDQYAAAQAFKLTLQSVASPTMVDEIEAEWQRIGPARFVGKSIDSIWQSLSR
ncbi:MAG: S8 family serine peptidase [Roseiflexaceae bacterium]